MKKIYIISIIVISIALLSLIIFNLNKKEICLNSNCINLKIADNEKERQQGLMYISSMKNTDGMLFIFQESSIHNFWMKNTLIPLDIIWLDDNKTINYITTVQPCKSDYCETYSSNITSRYVIELNAGVAKNLNLTSGMQLNF